ncbi:MAG: dihydrodipicolinate synthase family protein [Acidobacteria bacterium]|nr:MAG: dihydrodipicolinate synthase family protein [Acidobacteriales bacterium 13_1_40CM_3_55_5]PYX09462.1 MAG: dihydrodipicolinate synthase family protein [Acidobacteriota bacterium]PYX16199.1 MAG: dihydrodipicolinate synthase family protein [Acidobacteriota bacterium]
MTPRDRLRRGLVIPAHPLALNRERKLDEKHQRALTRYYVAAGAGGIAVGVHTTQFAIRDPKIGLFKPVLELAMEEMLKHDVVKIAGVCGRTRQAVTEAEIAKVLGYEVALLSLADLRKESVPALLDHVRSIAAMIPVMGFYLQPAVGGRILPYEFWRQFTEIEHVVAIKIAPFNRYQTIDVIRAVSDSGRAGEIALYTGNDDHILLDLLTEYDFGGAQMQIVGGLLGHWAVWTKCAVSQLASVKASGAKVSRDLLTLAQQITDSNAALFDPAHEFRGCIAGINEVLRRQGLLQGRWCLDPHEDLSPGQSEEIDRVCKIYPHLQDDAFVWEHLDEWLR